MKSKVIIFLSLFVFTILGGQLVYFVGGTHLPYVHFLYLPVIVAGFWLGISGGFFFAAFAGSLLGPFMPLDVVRDVAQEPREWLIRMVFFALVALLSGMGSQVTRAYLKTLRRRYLTDHETKIPNYKGLEELYKNEDSLATLSGIVVVKLRQVKEVEKAFGIGSMIQVAVKTKERLREILPENIILGRISSDAFAVC